MITSNAFQRTFFLRYGNSVGTCFAVDWHNYQYLVTAAHVVEGIKRQDTIAIFRNGDWQQTEVAVVGMGDARFVHKDIAVLRINHVIAHPDLQLDLSSDQLILSQHIYILGFPYGLHTLTEINNGFPIPIVKGGLLSGQVRKTATQNWAWIVDVHNNQGFSGGPLLFHPEGKTSGVLKVAGIVHGYRPEESKLQVKRGDVEISVESNSGIAYCPAIQGVIEMIDANPASGCPLS